MKYVVQKGDCLSKIAADHGFRDWKVLYDAPENDAFRKTRPNPNVIYPGDELVIPDKELKEESCATDQSHEFQAKKAKWMFRVEIRDEEFKALEGSAFRLFVDGVLSKEGKTGSNGLVEAPIGAEARQGCLEILGETIELSFGGLDPIARVTGVQQRLNNLGFLCGAVDGIVGRRTRGAVAAFQTAHGLEATGRIDDDTRAKLLEVHDNDKRVADKEDDMEQTEEPGDDAGGGESPEAGYAEDQDIVTIEELNEASIEP